MGEERSDADYSKYAGVLGCSEEEIEQLCEIFQKRPEELPDMLSGLNWSADKIARFAGTLSPDFIAVKFCSGQRDRDGMCAAFCVIYDSKRMRMIDEMYWVMHGSIPADFSVEEDWEKFRDRVNRLGGRFEKAGFDKFRPAVRSVLSRETLNKVVREDTPELRSRIVGDIIASITSLAPHRPDCSMDIEHFSAARLELGGIKPEKTENSGTTESEDEEVRVACLPVIDPANGVPAGQLEEGDRILVELVDGPGMAGIVYRLLSKSEAQPVFAVTSKELTNTGVLNVYFAISDEITGVVRVSPEVRVKTVTLNDFSGKGGFIIENLRDKIATLIVILIAVGLIALIISMLVQ